MNPNPHDMITADREDAVRTCSCLGDEAPPRS